MKILRLGISKENIKYFFFPILIFLGTYSVPPLYSISANGPTVPYFQWTYVILTILFFTSKKFIPKKNNNVFINSIVIVFLFYSIFISQVPFYDKISFVGVVLFAKIFSDIRSEKSYYGKIYSFVLSYMILSTLVYAVRMGLYNFDLYRARGGMNIWGGNSLIMVVYLFIVIQILLKRPKNEVFIFSLITLLLSLMFVTRITLVTSVILVTIQMFGKLKKNFFKVVVSMLILWGFFWKTFINSSLFETVSHRFSTFNLQQANDASAIVKNTSYGRSVLWELVGEILERNPMGIGVGSFKYFSIYSSPHNLVLNNFIESGVFFGFIINAIIFLPIFQLFFLKISLREKILAIFVYSSFLLNATVSGAKLIQTSGYTTSFILLFVFCVFNAIKYRNNLNKFKTNA